jgi:Cys-tRNA(Pro) deacylase
MNPPEVVTRVLAAILQRAPGAKLIHLESNGDRALSAAHALGVSLNGIVKSLVFLADGQPVLILVPGDRKADTGKLREVLHARRVTIADRSRVMEETGFAAGAVPPAGHARTLPTWVDQHLMERRLVYASAGAQDWVVALSPEALATATGDQVADVTKPSTK